MFLKVTLNIPSIFRYYNITGTPQNYFQIYPNNRMEKIYVNGDWSNEVWRSNGSTTGLSGFYYKFNDLPAVVFYMLMTQLC